MAEITIKMFGSPSITVDGRVVTFPYRKADALLYYLVLHKKVARNELAGLLWADSDAASALKNLRHAVYTIRKGIGFDIFIPGQWAALTLDPSVSIQCDVSEFLENGTLPEHPGEFLEGFSVQSSSLFEDWLTEERNLIQTQYLKRLLAAEKEAFAGGDLAAAERFGQHYIQLDHLEESASVTLMEVYGAQKKFRKAIGVYHDLCRGLSDELGISPLKETTALYYRIVNEWNASTYKIEEQPYHLLVGKDFALRQLLTLCSSPAAERKVPCALIQGEAGVGKTYLLDHILNCYDFSDWLVCRSFCYKTESVDPLSPWNSIMMALMSEIEAHGLTVPENYLKTAAGLFPCLSASFGQEYTVSDHNYPLQQNYHVARESVLLIFSTIAKQLPLLLAFEDIHWMDKSSVDMLALFLRRLRNRNVTVICTSRDVCPAYVRDFLDKARQDNILECYPIYHFSRNETEQFVQHYLSTEPTPELMEKIYQSTGGNALLLAQLVNSLQESSEAADLSGNMEDIIGYRLANLTQEERQVLDLISVFPDGASFETLSSILTKDTLELTYLCSQLKRRLLILELNREGTLCYALAHEQIQSTLMKQQSKATWRILHLRVARYLEAQMGTSRVPLYDKLIYHYSEGGDRIKSFQYRVLSLNAYTRMYYAVIPTLTEGSDLSGPKGISAYFQKLEGELAALRNSGSCEENLDQLEAILLHAKGCYCVYVGEYDVGLDALHRLLKLCEKLNHTKLLIRAHLQFVYYGIQVWSIPIMEDHLKAGMALLAGHEVSEEYGIYLRMEGLFHLMCGEYQQSRVKLQKSIDTFRHLAPDGDDRFAINIAGAYNYIAESHRLEGNYGQAFWAYDQAIIYNRSRGYYPGAAVFYTNYGVAAFQSGEKEGARQLFRFALETYRAAHEYSNRPIALSYLAFYEAKDGNFSLAAEYIREAFQVSDMLDSPWWKGITLYQCWKIREHLGEQGWKRGEFEGLWPLSQREHCLLCLSYLRQLPPRLETQEMEGALERLAEQTEE